MITIWVRWVRQIHTKIQPKLKVAESEHDDEDIIVLKAMIDVNLPQFVGDDISLFKGIVSDVFPNIPPPELNR